MSRSHLTGKRAHRLSCHQQLCESRGLAGRIHRSGSSQCKRLSQRQRAQALFDRTEKSSRRRRCREHHRLPSQPFHRFRSARHWNPTPRRHRRCCKPFRQSMLNRRQCRPSWTRARLTTNHSRRHRYRLSRLPAQIASRFRQQSRWSYQRTAGNYLGRCVLHHQRRHHHERP